jgi:hypothetical protein
LIIPLNVSFSSFVKVTIYFFAGIDSLPIGFYGLIILFFDPLCQVLLDTSGNPVYISETRDLYQYRLDLLPMEDTEHFDLIQDRTNNNERKYYEGCRVKNFELRIMRGEAIKLKLDICGECVPRVYPYADTFEREQGERFSGDCITYKINGNEYKNIYGLTLVSKKEGGTKTEIWIKRALTIGPNIPDIIDELTITAQLLRTQYEYRYFGTFRMTLKRLLLTSDETQIDSPDTVIGPLRYYVAGGVAIDVFSNN